MKTDRLAQLIPFMAFALFLGGAQIAAAAAPKVTLCHFPPDTPTNTQLILVSESSVPAHLAHNDAVCLDGDADCCFGGSDPSVCTSFDSDVNNCGDCGAVCILPNATAACTDGECSIGACDDGYGDCNDTAGDGCETNLVDDPNNCGGCGVVCAEGQVCTAGECVTACAAGEILCDGVCVNPATDSNNCGGCGQVCGTGEACADGGCTTNPMPECQGQTCETFTPCNTNDCSGAGVCGSTAEGGGLCVDGATPCAGLALCTTSADCPQGQICFVNSCCGTGVCVPTTQLCNP